MNLLKLVSQNVSVVATAAILLSATPALAMDSMAATSTGNSSHASTNYVCVQTAVDAREASIDSSWGTFSAAISSALSARATALHDSWGMGDSASRKSSRKAAWSAYSAASKSAHATLKSARDASWSTFTSASKDCKASVVENKGKDKSGSINI